MTTNMVETIKSYINASFPILYICTSDFYEADNIIVEACKGCKIREFNIGLGEVDFVSKRIKSEPEIIQDELGSICSFLRDVLDSGYDSAKPITIVLRDFHSVIEVPEVISYLKAIAHRSTRVDNYHVTIIVVSSKLVIPKELESDITIVDMPLPNMDIIKNNIRKFITEKNLNGVSEDVIGELAIACKGLNVKQITQILSLAYDEGGVLTKNDTKLVLEQKKQILKKNDLLELITVTETLEDIGGLRNLKDWLKRKSRIFNDLNLALEKGCDEPQGLMLTGFPGCGKSLAAKATSKFFNLPLIRLDIGRLMGKYVGDSEGNMRMALKLAESMSPCVLWIDEIEKAFAGVGGFGGGSDITTRLFGQFLTWMQEKKSSVFIVATANSVANIPPEFLRKGRFDETFFVDYPNREESIEILNSHLKRRKQKLFFRETSESSDCSKIIYKLGEDYSGAELESIVKDSIEHCFLNDKELSYFEILETLKRLKPSKSKETLKKERTVFLDEYHMTKAN